MGSKLLPSFPTNSVPSPCNTFQSCVLPPVSPKWGRNTIFVAVLNRFQSGYEKRSFLNVGSSPTFFGNNICTMSGHFCARVVESEVGERVVFTVSCFLSCYQKLKIVQTLWVQKSLPQTNFRWGHERGAGGRTSPSDIFFESLISWVYYKFESKFVRNHDF